MNRIIAVIVPLVLLLSSAPATARDLWVGTRNVDTIHGRITDKKGNPIKARVELWYADMGLVEEENGEALPMSEQYQRNLYHVDFSDDDGWYHVNAPDGEWLLRFSKGPEWEIEEHVVQVSDGELDGKRLDISLRHLYNMEAKGWFSGDMHHHTIHSDGRQTPRQVRDAMIANDLDFAALTDHNQISGNEIWEELGSPEFLPIPGVEITTSALPEVKAQGKGWGHMNAIGIQSLVGATYPDDPVLWKRYLYTSAADQQSAVDETHAEGGLFMLSHSCWGMDWPDGTISTWGELKDYDAVSVFVGWDVGPHMPTILASEYGPSIFGTAQWNLNTMATQAWFELLNAGNRVAGWASSDAHDVYSLQHTGNGAPVYWRNTSGNARTYVKSGELTWPDVRHALKKGNAFVTAGYWGPLLMVTSRGGQGPGDVVRVKKNGKVPLKIKVLSNRPLADHPEGIRIIQGGKVIKTIPTEGGKMKMKVKTQVSIDVTKDTWIVVEVFGQWPSMAMTNPIYLDVEPYGPWGAPQWQSPKGADEWFNPFPNAPTVTVPDGPSQPPLPVEPVNPGEYRKTY